MTDTKVNKNKEKKQQIVAAIQEKVAKAKAMVFTNYEGMTHLQIEALKKGLRGSNAELAITKNTLLKRALEAVNKEWHMDKFDQPTATLFAYDDPITPLKELTKSLKALAQSTGLSRIKSGIFDGAVLEEKDVIRLSTLPPRNILIAQVVGGIKSPFQGLHRALSWNMQKLVMTLNAIGQTKQY